MKILKKSVFLNVIKGLTVGLLFFFSATSAQAQELEISPTAGYFWGGKLRTYYGELRLGSNMSYGLTGDMSVAPGTLFEISWFINSSDATYYEYGYFDYLDNFKLTTNYIHLGIVQEMNYGESFRPYGLFSMGTTIFSSKEYYDVWRFSLGIGGGLKYYFSDTFGLKFQGTFLLPVYFNGGGIYCGTGGCGYGIYSGTAVAQGDVKLGLVIVLQ